VKIKVLYLILLGLIVNVPAFAMEQQDSLKLLAKVWTTAKENIYPAKLRDKFTDKTYESLKLSMENASFSDSISILNSFLYSLSVSHTGLYSSKDESYYFLKSLFKEEGEKALEVGFLGFQTTSDEFCSARVSEVLDGFQSSKIGILRGDCILSIAGEKYYSIKQLNNLNGKSVSLEWSKGDKLMRKNVKIESVDLTEAFHRATLHSAKVFHIKKKKIGYVHLWTGTHEDSAEVLNRLIKDKFKNTDGLIIDLRGGYGGAWWDHLIPFYSDTSTFFKATKVNTDGTKIPLEMEFRKNEHAYKKPMVVLINEGVRSGKEAMAFQFKKTKRALLVGTTTAGYFVAGKAFFVERDLPYVLYLSVSGLLLDGDDIEGRGVLPDIKVDYPLTGVEFDPQMVEAKKVISELVE
jgi:carboxyl-terminal processing protease